MYIDIYICIYIYIYIHIRIHYAITSHNSYKAASSWALRNPADREGTS